MSIQKCDAEQNGKVGLKGKRSGYGGRDEDGKKEHTSFFIYFLTVKLAGRFWVLYYYSNKCCGVCYHEKILEGTRMTQDVAAVRLTNRPPFSIRYLIRGKVGTLTLYWPLTVLTVTRW